MQLGTRGTEARGRRIVAVACAGALAALCALPALAQARIAPGKGVAGVYVGDSTAQVKKVLGAPEAGSNVLNYRYVKSRGIGIYFIAGKAFEIAVVRGPQATASGVRIGSSRAKLTSAYPKARCRPGAISGTTECRLPSRFRARATETLFTLKGDKVSRIAVHFV
ncbi:MAG: hypothetical protein AB7G65_03370 [Thermoleophilia bacterium]